MMRILVALIFAVCAVNAATDQDLWLDFKESNSKEYRNLREETKHFEIFQNNLRRIEEHNEKYDKGEITYHLGITPFADLTHEEFLSMLNKSLVRKPNYKNNFFEPDLNISVPRAVNWVSKGAVLEVKNQGSCGSCWAFSATGALEGQNAIKHNKTVALSEQNLLDCSSDYGNNACEGGLMNSAFEYVKENGITTEGKYPYTAQEGICSFKTSESVLKISGYRVVRPNENRLKIAVGIVGPISIGVDASYFQLYTGGIFNEQDCSHFLNHGVLAVGYGNDGQHDYWLVKNSWGTSWGENGYIRMIRNANNQCGVADAASYPLVEKKY